MAQVTIRIKNAPMDGASLAKVIHHIALQVEKMDKVKKLRVEGPDGGLIGWVEVYK